MRRTILIGDVHGCPDELQELLRAVGFGRGDQVIFVGDLVAKGPDSQAVVQIAREIRARGVRGNHDHHVLTWRRKKGPDTKPLKPHHQKVADTLTDADWKWLEGLPLVLRLHEHKVIVVHAGFVPGVPINQQRAEFLLNLRSVTQDGRPSKKIEGTPWASTWAGPEEVIFGHDAMRGLQQHAFATGLDTGCVYGKELTAYLLPERRFVSVKARRAYCEPKSKD